MEHADRIRLNVLGGLDALGSDGHPLRFPTRHCGFVLAMLAATPQHRLRREAIAGCLWSERGESQARASLRQTIHHLQKALRDAGCPALEVERDNLALLPPYVSCDLWELQHVLNNNPKALGDLHTGEFLASYGRADPAFDEWVAAARHSLTADVGTALRSLASEGKTCRSPCRSGTINQPASEAFFLTRTTKMPSVCIWKLLPGKVDGVR